jgi:hypothetical protein
VLGIVPSRYVRIGIVASRIGRSRNGRNRNGRSRFGRSRICTSTF